MDKAALNVVLEFWAKKSTSDALRLANGAFSV
jgi:hypothetical protein